MKYEGKIYGKVAGKYIEVHTTKDLDESIANKEKLIKAKDVLKEIRRFDILHKMKHGSFFLPHEIRDKITAILLGCE